MDSEEAETILAALQRYGPVKTESDFPEPLKATMERYCGFYRAGERDGEYHYFLFCQEWLFRYDDSNWYLHRIE